MSSAKAIRSSVISPVWDFWLLGGFSLVAFLYLWVVGKASSLPISASALNDFIYASSFLQIIINFPHFMASYHFAYRQKIAFITQHWLQLLLVPIFLIVSFAWIYWNTSILPKESQWALTVNALIEPWTSFKFNTLRSSYNDSISFLARLMFLSVGWHYSKQVFGCSVWTSRAQGVQWKSIDHRGLHGLFLFFWLTLAIGIQLGGETVPFYDLSVPYFGVHLKTQSFLYAMALVAGITVIAWLALRNWQNQLSFKNSALILIAPVSFLFWWHPYFYHKEFSGYGVPFFHSLQYLAFVVAVNRSENWSPTKSQITWALLILSGVLMFTWVPSFLDNSISFADAIGNKRQFFLVSFLLFINIHHYFIDSVIWKGPAGLGAKAMKGSN